MTDARAFAPEAPKVAEVSKTEISEIKASRTFSSAFLPDWAGSRRGHGNKGSSGDRFDDHNCVGRVKRVFVWYTKDVLDVKGCKRPAGVELNEENGRRRGKRKALGQEDR